MPLTTKELSALEDTLGFEQTIIKKYAAMSGQCADPVIKNKLSAMSARHQQHYNMLMNHLQ